MSHGRFEYASMIVSCFFLAVETGCKTSPGSGTVRDAVEDPASDTLPASEDGVAGDAVDLTSVDPRAELEELYGREDDLARLETFDVADDAMGSQDPVSQDDATEEAETAPLPWEIVLEVCGPSFESCVALSGYLRDENHLRVSSVGPGPSQEPCFVSLVVNGSKVQECAAFPCEATVAFERDVKHAVIEATATCAGEEKKVETILPVFIPWLDNAKPCIRWGEWTETVIPRPPDQESEPKLKVVELDRNAQPHLFGITGSLALLHLFENESGWQREKIPNRKFLQFPFAVISRPSGDFSVFATAFEGYSLHFAKAMEITGSETTWDERLLWLQHFSCVGADCPSINAVLDEDGSIELLSDTLQVTPECYELVPEELYPFCDLALDPVFDAYFLMRVRLEPSGNMMFLGPYYPPGVYQTYELGLVDVDGPGAVGFYHDLGNLGFVEIHGDELSFVPVCEGHEPQYPGICSEGCWGCGGLPPARVFDLPDRSGIGVISYLFQEPGVSAYRTIQRLVYRPGTSPVFERLPMDQALGQAVGEGFVSDFHDGLVPTAGHAIMDGLGRSHFVVQWIPADWKQYYDSDWHGNPGEWLLYISEYGTGDPTDWTIEVMTMADGVQFPVLVTDDQGTTYVFASVRSEPDGPMNLTMWKRSCVEWYEPLEPTEEP